jgi:hypothetical protein
MKSKHNWNLKISAKDKEQVADVAYTVDNKTRVYKYICMHDILICVYMYVCMLLYVMYMY